MSEVGEAMGTATEGGLFARVLSRRAGNARAKSNAHFQEVACLNCATPLIGTHCHTCGQAAHLHRTLGALGHDLMHGVLHLDGKVWRTLPLLAWKPGELTRRYIHGERSNFVSPMALFLFSIFLMFAVFQIAGLSMSDLEIDNPRAVWDAGAARADLDAKLADTLSERVAVDRQIAALNRRPVKEDQLGSLELRAAALEEQIADLEAGQAALATVGGTMEAGANAGTPLPSTGLAWLDQSIAKWRSNPGLMLYKLQANSYKFSWLLIPLSLPFMWLLFAWKRGVRVYDHAIFITYSIAFMSLLFVTASLLGVWGVSAGIIVPLVTILPAWHLYRQLRGAYALSRFSALWRLAVLSVMIMIVVTLFLQILLVLGAF